MTMSSRPTLLVGSVPLESAEAVFSMAGDLLGGSLRSIPDGETGERLGWYTWQQRVLGRAPFLKRTGCGSGNDEGVDQFELGRFRVAGDLADADLGKLGYADAAIASYKMFAALREKGRIPGGVRFQVSLPTPIAPLAAMIEPDDYLKVEPIYEAAMRKEIQVMCNAIPVDDLAIQWDVAMEIGILEGLLMLGGRKIFADPMKDMVHRLVKVVSWVPQSVALGLHFCYGDYQHKHWKEPKDTGLMVQLGNASFAGISRKLDWLHLPVPRNRDDDAYFAPLADLKLPSGTQLYLGLAHYTDGVEGGKRRLRTAARHVRSFGIATECGLGRRPPETIPEVMKLMAALASV